MSMRDVFLAVLIAGGLAACGGDDDGGGDDGGSIAGTYFGDLAIQHNVQGQSVFAATELVVAGDGDLAGSQLTTKSPTATIGEAGTITGSLEVSGAATADADLTITFPTLGTFTVSGTATWSEATGQVAATLPTRQDGSVIGMTTFALTQE
jgi:hypothetical protein